MVWLDASALFKCGDSGDFVSIRIIDMTLADRNEVIAGMSLSQLLIQLISLRCLPNCKTGCRVGLLYLVVVLRLLTP